MGKGKATPRGDSNGTPQGAPGAVTAPATVPPGRLSVRRAYAGKHIFVTGTTGFVGKVLLAMIAAKVPDVRRVSVLVRTNREYDDARERFDAVVALSEPFQAVAEMVGVEHLERWCDEVVNVVAGDITEAHLGLSDADYQELTVGDPIDLILHCAGNVDFKPPLDQALAVNSQGATHKVQFAKAAGAPLVHMSTCFVAGCRTEFIDEDREVIGYAPNGQPFDPERELADAVYLAQEVRHRADAQALEARFYDEAKDILTSKGLDYEDPGRLQDAFRTCKKRWVDNELMREGAERAEQWGWTNTYTYTKSLGEQLTMLNARKLGVALSIVRPAIVESTLEFPFPGWNEGINTCAPFVYIMFKGQRFIPANPDNILDLVPVDLVARGTLNAGAALLDGQPGRVYQFSSGDHNPLHLLRAVELTNLAWRRKYDQDEKNLVLRHLKRNLESVVVDRATYQSISAPAVNRWSKGARKALKAIPVGLLGPARPLVKQLDGALGGLEKSSRVCDSILALFAPFVLDNNPCFGSVNTRALSATLVDEEQADFSYDMTNLDWLHYWRDVHLEGLHKWVFGHLDDKMRPVRKVARPRDLIEVFRTATRAFAERKALSYYTAREGVTSTYTYAEFWDSARCVAGWLRAHGIGPGDAVVLAAKNEPAWPMIYLGILLADAVTVPLDPEMPAGDARRICDKADAKLVIVHEDQPKDHRWDIGRPRAFVGDVFESEPIPEVDTRDRSKEIASLLFTSGTTGDPKGVMLTHANFTALLASLHGTFRVDHKDRFLSILPLFHTFEFSCGFLMPISAGAHIMYLEELEGPLLREALKSFRPSGLIGVPALWDVLHKRIETQVKDRGEAAQLAFTSMLRLSRFLREKYGVNLGPMMFQEVHRTMGGRIRHLISGGAALSEPVLEAFEGLGFELLEGYGLTEAAPVLTVRRPGDRRGSGSVGKQLPGVEVQIINPDADGVGEVIAKGDNVMSGYLGDPTSTSATVRKGWLHTGDLGKLDRDGRLILMGRRKELIVTSSGKNVYPDELEPLYAAHDHIDELCICGIPDPQGDERVAALVVLKEGLPDDAQAEVKAHFTKVSQGLADHQRVRTMRFWHEKLPRTGALKVKRKEVREEIVHLLDLSKASRREAGAVPEGREPAWIYASIAGLTGHEAVDIELTTHLTQDLGIGSLQLVELRVLLEERGAISVDGERLAAAQTVRDVIALCSGASSKSIARADDAEPDDAGRGLPEPLDDAVSAVGRRVLRELHRVAYDKLLAVRVKGREHVPHNRQAIVIANHCSHLDLGLVKYALADYAPNLSALAAQDYFFNTQYKRDFFEPFTNLIPVDRTAPLESSLRYAEKAMREGRIVLVFPEGTRSVDGQLQEFKHGIGYLQAKSGLPILPVYLRGTYRAMPKGSAVPASRKLTAVVGPVIEATYLAKLTEGKNRIETYAAVATTLQQAIEALRDGGEYPWTKRAKRAAVGEDPLIGLFAELPEKFQPKALKKTTTWYFSLGDKADGKWTLVADLESGARYTQGRPTGGAADCVLKTDIKTFERICREGYVPSMNEFMDGRVKTNDPDLLMQFKAAFGL